MTILQVNNLRTYFHTRNGIVKAVDGVNFYLKKGQTLGIVGESGCGKSVTNYSLLGLLPMPPGRIESGQALFHGKDLLKTTREEMRQIRGQRISMIFQDPMTCLNPYMRIGDQLMESLFVHQRVSKAVAQKKAISMLDEVGIQDAKKRLLAYPHELSGGMKQRVMIAMALITEPEILIADEPTTALDVTVEAQILDLIKREQQLRHMSVIYITHNLGVIAGLADRIAVMYAGRIVEKGNTEKIFYRPEHPYTKALLESIPSAHERGEILTTIPGLPPDLSKKIRGCAFAPRCTKAMDECDKQRPIHVEVEPDHLSACFLSKGGVL